jgi:glycosyltransferase involved in cell wall biosynthesis
MTYSKTNLPRVAWVSPFPPQRSGIANYSYRLVQALRPQLPIDLYYDKEEPVAALKDAFQVYPLSAFRAQHENYDEVIYHLGNNRLFHTEIYKLAWEFPDTIVLHDYNLSAFMHEAFSTGGDRHLYRRALVDGDDQEGPGGLQGLIQKFIPGTSRLPMSGAIVNRSRRVIVHHRWVKNQFAKNSHIQVIPHFAEINCRPTAEEVQNFKKKFALKDNYFVLSCLGFINRNKLPDLQIKVVKRLINEGYPVQMVFAGEPAPDVEPLVSEIRSSRYRENIIFTGYLDEQQYFSAIFASDVIVNLRNPSMGEASGTLMHALAAAKPTVISNLNQYREFPDKVCWKLTHDSDESEVLYAYLTSLLVDRNLRAAISRNAAEYVESVLDLEKVAAEWKRVILS